MLKGLEIKKIDPYKASSAVLGGLGGFFVAKKKGYDLYHTIILVLFGSSMGVVLPDIIDGFRQNDPIKTADLTDEKKGIFVNHVKKNLVWVVLGLVIAYFVTQKDRHNNKQLAVLGLFVLIYSFLVAETISKTSVDDLDDNSFHLFKSKIEAEVALFGIMLGLFIAYVKGGETGEMALYPLIGLGGGMLISSSISKKAHDSNFSETIEEQNKGINKKRKKTKLVLYSISKSSIGRLVRSKRDFVRDKYAKKIDKFILGLSDRQLVVFEKVYDKIQDEISNSKPITTNKIIDILRTQKFDEKDIETFFQVADRWNVTITGKTLDASKIGKPLDFVLRRKTQEYEIDDNDDLRLTGVIYESGDKLSGKERWIWLSSVIDNKNVRKQVRLIEVGKGKYIFHIGVDKL